VKLAVAMLGIPLSRHLLYLQADARNTSSGATGHALAGNNLEKLLASIAESRKACAGSLSKGGTLLPTNIDGFDEFEVMLQRAWEIQNSEPQRAGRKMRSANDSLQAANQGCGDSYDNKNAEPGPVSAVTDAQRRPIRESE